METTMHPTRVRLVLGAATFALVAATWAGARAADAPGDSSFAILASSSRASAWDTSTTRPPQSERERLADRVQQMDQELLRRNGSNLPGEDGLGNGTSLTH
jgi:hypothetical protein